MATAEPPQMGEPVYIIEDVIDHDGVLLAADKMGRGYVVGSKGLYTSVVQWGTAGDYRYADVPHASLRKYETRSSR